MAGIIQSWEQDDAGENFNIEGAADKKKKERGTLDTSTEEAIYNERTLLGTAIVNGDLEKVKRLVADGEPVDEVGKWGYTPLHAAANLGHNEIVKFLIDNGADVNRDDNERKATPLDVAKTKEVAETLRSAVANSTSYSQSQLDVSKILNGEEIPYDKSRDEETKKWLEEHGGLTIEDPASEIRDRLAHRNLPESAGLMVLAEPKADTTELPTASQVNESEEVLEQTFDAFANMDFSPNLGSLDSIFGNTTTNQNTLTPEPQVNTAEALTAAQAAQPAAVGQLSRKEIDDVMDMGKGDVKYDKDAVKVVEDMMRANGLEVKDDGKVSRGERDALESFLQKSGTQQQLDALRAAFEAAGGRGGDDAKASEPRATTYNVTNPIDGTSMSIV